MITEQLRTGRIDVIGRHPYASNQVFIVDCTDANGTTRAIYKPVAGERPLWDFPRGELARREVATFAVAQALAIDVVPVTVWREDGPFGPGSMQQWIEDVRLTDVDVVQSREPGWLPVLDAELEDGTPVQVVHRDLPELRALALLDAIINNGDRKAGHILRDAAGALWAVDHGVTFHVEHKLRSVLWGFEGDAISQDLVDRLHAPLTDLADVRSALDAAELEALAQRVTALLHEPVYPGPSDQWPAIPWPIW